jgi:lipopolysaccharide export system protein LptA
MAKILLLLYIVISVNLANAENDMVIRGETMSHDTKTDTTTSDGGKGLATAEWGKKESLKKLQAKKIVAKTKNNDPKSPNKTVDDTNNFSNDIEWIEAIDEVQITSPNKKMTADYCKSYGKTIKCRGNVTIKSGKNTVTGDNGSFDLENDLYTISSDPKAENQVEVTLYSDKLDTPDS